MMNVNKIVSSFAETVFTRFILSIDIFVKAEYNNIFKTSETRVETKYVIIFNLEYSL